MADEMGGTTSVLTREPRTGDAAAVAEIYNEGIRGRDATFETRERSTDDALAWMDQVRYPLLVAEADGRVVGWARVYEYRPRECYDGVGEFSVYVRGDVRQRGVGAALLNALATACTEAGYWKLVSRVFPENAASRALCARCGFREVGTYRRHARLDGRWRDVIIVERLLEEETGNGNELRPHQAPSHQEPTTRHEPPTPNP
jgi:phosphinothricin acetyltransferase